MCKILAEIERPAYPHASKDISETPEKSIP